jgi:hypothetical protein
VRTEHLLAIPGTLHRPQHTLKIAPDMPLSRSDLLGKAHFL